MTWSFQFGHSLAFISCRHNHFYHFTFPDFPFTRCTHKSLPVLLTDGPTEQYFAYQFDTSSVCAPGINLQTHTSSVRRPIASVLYHPVIKSKFVPEKEHLRHALLFLFNQKKKTVESYHLLMVNTLHRLEYVRHGFDNLKW